jgi:hypothetical protein
MKKLIAIATLVLLAQCVLAQTNPAPNAVTDLKQNGNTIDYANRQAMEAKIDDVPESARTSFNQKYNGKTARWYRSDSGYWATYPGNDNMHEQVLFDSNGKMTGTGRQIKTEMLPPTSTDYLMNNYKGAKYQDVYKITPVTGDPYYEVFINDRWVKFDNRGNYVPIK